MDKLIYRKTQDGRNYYVVQRSLGSREWLTGYVSVTRDEKHRIDDPTVTFKGIAGDAIPSWKINPLELLIGIDTADPVDNNITVDDVVNVLKNLVRELKEM